MVKIIMFIHMYNDFFRFVYFIVLSSPAMLLRDKDKYSLPVIKIAKNLRMCRQILL